MAQDVLQVQGVRHGAQHAQLQGLQQGPLLRGAYSQGEGDYHGRHTRAEAYTRKY